jgi:serine/threonine-protein kinase RIO1
MRYPVVIKVWNKPSKQLMESMKPFYEDDAEFVEKVNNSKANPDFRELWAEREMKLLNKLSQAGINCVKGLSCSKSVLIMDAVSCRTTLQEITVGEDQRVYTPRELSTFFNNTFSVS